MNTFKQIRAVTLLNLQHLPQRFGTSMIIVVGITCVVAVLVSVLAMATGFSKTVDNTGRRDRVVVLRGGSQAELNSSISRDNMSTIMNAPGVKHDADGKPLASAEVMVVLNLPRKDDPTESNVALRGIGPQGFALRPKINLVAGRMFQPAVHEIVVGKSAQAQFKGLDLGAKVSGRGSEWTVVGVFESGGDSHESELIGDTETILSAHRRNMFQSQVALLESADAFDAYKAALTTNPTLSVDVLRETEYFANQSSQFSTIMFFVGYVVGGIMALGALFGALTTMYSAIEARAMEIATLRAIGFGAVAVVVSVFTEALLLALAGGVVGALIAWTVFNGNLVNTLNQNFTQVVFPLAVTPGLLLLGVIWAVFIGLAGGLFPAVRAARLPVSEALQVR